MTIGELLRESTRSQNPADAEHLLAHVCKQPRTWLLAHPEAEIPAVTARRYAALTARRGQGEPLAYLLKSQPFYGLDFIVSRSVLIPRSESEWLVAESLKILGRHPNIRTVIDVGTGSGCLIISTLKNLTSSRRRTLMAFGTDISRPALAVAKRNAEFHNAEQIKFLKGDLLTPLAHKLTAYGLLAPRSFSEVGRLTAPTLLLANLPYGTTTDYQRAAPSVRNYEPKLAIHAGRDGLRYYRRLVAQISKIHSSALYCVWEIDPCHATTMARLFKRTFPKSTVRIQKDFNHLDRYLVTTIHPPTGRRSPRSG